MRNRLVGSVAVLSLTLAAAWAVPATPAAAQSTAPDAQAQMKAEMDAYTKLSQPGENHKRLGTLVGKWTVTGKAWMAPGQPPVEIKSTMEASWVAGGRFVQQVSTGNFMGQPFEGRALEGYDNVSHEFISTWIDNMGTGIEVYHGSCDNPCRVLTTTTEFLDPLSGKMVKAKNVTTFLDADNYRVEMYMVGVGPGGKDVEQMEMNAKRQR
jgi:Protein of unknown function (DUF1579)